MIFSDVVLISGPDESPVFLQIYLHNAAEMLAYNHNMSRE